VYYYNSNIEGFQHSPALGGSFLGRDDLRVIIVPYNTVDDVEEYFVDMKAINFLNLL
jgi:hypothetical protein